MSRKKLFAVVCIVTQNFSGKENHRVSTQMATAKETTNDLKLNEIIASSVLNYCLIKVQGWVGYISVHNVKNGKELKKLVVDD